MIIRLSPNTRSLRCRYLVDGTQVIGTWVTEIPLEVFVPLTRARTTGHVFEVEIDASDAMPLPPGIKWDRP